MRGVKAKVATALLMVAGAFAASAVECITDVMLIGGTQGEVNARKNTYTNQGWKVINQDLNAGCGSSSDYIYLLVKSASVEDATNGFITGFYIKTGSSGVTQTMPYEDRTYRLVPYDGGDHFKGQKGDLNSNAGGAAIHLYCTKSAFPDNRAVTGVSFDGTQSGAVGADGGSEGYDLNDGCGGETDYIYMHVTTAAVPYVSPVSVTDVVARQRWPWNGLVDIACTVSGSEWEPDGHDFAVAAVMDSSVYNATHLWVAKDGKKSPVQGVCSNGNYRLIWDAGADLGPELYSNVVVRVTVKGHAKVQLWEGGPYWATTNVGAEKPENYGYYFWWGDTTGYRTSGTTFSFSFEPSNCPTYEKSESQLKEGGWLTDGGVLAPEHDAAQAHWGGAWRMPTKQELDDLVNKCDWNETTLNGVKGWIVTGRDAYKSDSIFLPCAGYGYGPSLDSAGSNGHYWSSVPNSDSNNYAWYLNFNSSDHSANYFYSRYGGQSVRPVQGFTE